MTVVMSEKSMACSRKVLYAHCVAVGVFRYGIGERRGDTLIMPDGSMTYGYYSCNAPCFEMDVDGFRGAVELQRKLGIIPELNDYALYCDMYTNGPHFMSIVISDAVKRKIGDRYSLDGIDDCLFVLMKSPL